MQKTSVALLLILALLVFVVAVSPAMSQSETPTNHLCPVMIGTKVDPAIWVDHEGRRVWFCCESCRERFRADPAFYLASLDSQAGAAVVGDDLYPGWDGSSDVVRLVRFLGRFHPVAVHFPIAFALGALMADILALAMRQERCRNAARFLLILGAFGAICSVPVGWAAAYRLAVPPDTADSLFSHRWLGTAGGSSSWRRFFSVSAANGPMAAVRLSLPACFWSARRF